MRVVHVSFSDKSGGAAIAAYRHHESMRLAGIDSKMLVLYKYTDDKNVFEIKRPKIRFFLYRVINKLLRMKSNFYASWSLAHFGCNIDQEAIIKNTDAIIIHWVNNNTLSLKSIEKILSTGKSVYWFMHDMWPITGGCHHALKCERYKTHCLKCPMYHNGQGSRVHTDISYFQFKEKFKRLSGKKNLHFITPSHWLANKVKKSSLFGSHDIKVMRNVLNTNIFKQTDKFQARARLNLPTDKKLILFGADNIHSPYKGWNYLQKALNKPLDGIECVVYGTIQRDIQSQVSCKVHQIGKISEESKIIDLYNACDVFVSPSLADNYPNVILEAMACGLPVVAFPSGGIPEIVKTGVNGILTSSPNANELYTAIIQILTMPLEKYRSLRDNARHSIVQNNDYAAVRWH